MLGYVRLARTMVVGGVLTSRKWEWAFSPLTIGSPILSEVAWGMGKT